MAASFRTIKCTRKTTVTNSIERLSFVCRGVRVELLANERNVLDKAAAVLPVGSRHAALSEVDASYRFSESRSGAGHLLSVDGKRVAGPAELSEILNAFEPHLTVRVAERAPEHVFVHAGVVGWRGRAVVLPGYSFAGKTTLVADLVRAGALYYSDEYAVLDREGRVHPFARPLHVRKPGERRQIRVDVERLGGSAGHEPLAIGLIAFCRFKAGAQWRPQLVTPGRAALEMFRYTMSARYAPEAALAALERAVAGATSIKGTRGESGAVVEYIASLLDA